MAATLSAQTTDFSFAHGLPGLPNPVDVVVDGNTVFTGLNFGDLQTTTIAPGGHTIEVQDGGVVLLSASTTTGVDENFTAAAHLLEGGAANLAVFQNNVDAVDIAGQGRFDIRHLADAGPVAIQLESPGAFNLSALANGTELPNQVDPAAYDLSVLPLANFTFPFPPSSRIAQGIALAQDQGVIAHIVGVPGTPSFSVITQTVALEPAVPVTPNACDLTLSGTLPGGSLAAGGTLDIGVTGASADSFVVVFLALDNTPTMFFDIPLAIGGGGFFDVLLFGLADNAGDFSRTLNFGPVMSTTIGQPGPSTTFDFFLQAVSRDFVSAGFRTSCISDVEPLQFSLR